MWGVGIKVVQQCASFSPPFPFVLFLFPCCFAFGTTTKNLFLISPFPSSLFSGFPSFPFFRRTLFLWGESASERKTRVERGRKGGGGQKKGIAHPSLDSPPPPPPSVRLFRPLLFACLDSRLKKRDSPPSLLLLSLATASLPAPTVESEMRFRNDLLKLQRRRRRGAAESPEHFSFSCCNQKRVSQLLYPKRPKKSNFDSSS